MLNVADGANAYTHPNHSGDVTSSADGAQTIAADAVTFAKMQNVAANSILIRDANSSGDLSELAVADTKIVIGDGTGFGAFALSGDVTMTNGGVVTIAATSVENSMLADDAVGADELASNAVVNASVASGAAIEFSKMENLTASKVLVSDGSGDVSASAVTSTELGILDGGTSAISTTLVDADRVIVNDAGTMKQVALTDLTTYNESATNVTITELTSVAGSNAYTVSHESADKVLVYRNGVLLDSTEITTNAPNNTVTFTCLDTTDKAVAHVISALSVTGLTTYRPTAVAGSNAYSVVNDSSDTVLVFKNGVLLDDGDLTISTSNDTVTFTCTDTSDEITIQVFGNITAVSDRQAVVKHTPNTQAGSYAYSISNASGDLVQAFRNGVLLGSGDITISSTNDTVTLTCTDTSDLVEIYVMGSVTVGTASALGTLTTDVKTPTNKKVIQQGAFLQSSTHQAIFLGA
jgi:hypothetical protein